MLCGQVFRYSKTENGFNIIASDKQAKILYKDGGLEIEQNDANFFANYFDLHSNYDIIIKKLEDGGILGEAVRFGRGIRILRQDPVEIIISFIISANNHIPRIKGIIERLCKALGKCCGDYYAFPKVEKLASADADFYRCLGGGNRCQISC